MHRAGAADDTLVAKADGHTMTSLLYECGGASAARYEFELPQIYLTGGPENAQRGQAVRTPFNVQAVIGNGTGPLTIPRVPAA